MLIGALNRVFSIGKRSCTGSTGSTGPDWMLGCFFLLDLIGFLDDNATGVQTNRCAAPARRRCTAFRNKRRSPSAASRTPCRGPPSSAGPSTPPRPSSSNWRPRNTSRSVIIIIFLLQIDFSCFLRPKNRRKSLSAMKIHKTTIVR